MPYVTGLFNSYLFFCHKNVIFTLLVIKLVLISVPTIYLSYLIAITLLLPTKFGIQTLGPSETVAMSIVTDRRPYQ